MNEDLYRALVDLGVYAQPAEDLAHLYDGCESGTRGDPAEGRADQQQDRAKGRVGRQTRGAAGVHIVRLKQGRESDGKASLSLPIGGRIH